MRRGLLVLMIAVVMTGQAVAVQRCADGDTLQTCFDRAESKWKKTSETYMQKETVEANTGVGDLLSTSQSATKDFLSRLAGAFAVPMSGDGSRPVSIDFNHPVKWLGDTPVKVQTTFAKPEISGDLEERLGSNATALAAVEDSLSEFDDVTVSASSSPAMRWCGRSSKPHKEFYADLLDQYVSLERTSFGDLQRPFRSLLPEERSELEAAFAAAETRAMQFAERFAKLLSNQPQIYGSVLYHARKNVAGPDERSVRITYEKGFDNLNKLYAIKDRCKSEEGTNPCKGVLEQFLRTEPGDTDGTEETPLPENRVSMSIEYRMSDGMTVHLPKHTVHYQVSKARSVVYSLAYGRNHMMTAKGRLDLAVNYEDTTASTATDVITAGRSGGPAALANGDASQPIRDRFVASATYTYKMTAMMSMPLTLTYANHAAFLGDVDRKLSAHFGISFKMR